MLQDIRGYLQNELETLVDVEFVLHGEPLVSKISDAIWRADLMVPILHEKALASPWVISEIVRADERGLTIIPVVEVKSVNKMPAFLRERLYVDYEMKSTEIFRLKSKIIEAIKKWWTGVNTTSNLFQQKRSIRRHAAILQKWIQAHCQTTDREEFRPLQLTLIDTILSGCMDEIEAVKSLNYQQNIGREREFVIRAKPVFEGASKILATSIDSVSTFWENLELQRATREYISAQNPNATYRLFVFSNAGNAHKYGNLLGAHFRRYGTGGGGVFVCSLDAYRHNILPSIAERHHTDRLMRTDFALLTYAQKEGTSEVLEATLDQSVFTVMLHRPGRGLVHREGFENMFAELERLKDGELNDKYQVLRWCPRFLSPEESERDKWADALKSMFSGRYGDVYHMVFFSSLASKQLSSVLDVKNAILKLKDELQKQDAAASPSEVWFGSRIAMTVRDALGGGEIDVGNAAEMPYVLTMKFSSEAALKTYYEDHAHSDARRTLYEKLNPDMIPLYELIDRHPEEIRKAIWGVINRIGKDWIERRDYVDNETFKFVARRPIPSFE